MWSQYDDDGMVERGYYSDMGPVMEEDGLNDYDADDEVFSSSVVHKGDRVMIQSKVTGKFEHFSSAEYSEKCVHLK